MADLSTEYLGLKLKNPLVPSSSPLSKHMDSAKRLEDAGASAIVMHSLFEEKIEEEQQNLARFFHQQSLGHGEADSFHPIPDEYQSYQDVHLMQLQKLKAELDIPVIASLNGTTAGGWIEYASALQDAGADALELNYYYIAAERDEDCNAVEDRYVETLRALKQQVSIPVTMKLSSQFSALVNVAKRFELAGAEGLVLFNRFYQPDIDLDTLEVVPRLELSHSDEALLRIRWIAILFGRVSCSLAITGGVHSTEDVLKALLAGADVTHMCSALLHHGPEHLQRVLNELEQWLDQREYESVSQLKGSISQQRAIDPAAYARANYVNVLESFKPPPGVRW
ncbi:MAG: dihydroorotate dehydrogenase-like protein [Halioglobus sp.]